MVLILFVSLVRRYRRDPESLRLWLTPTLATAGGPRLRRRRDRGRQPPRQQTSQAALSMQAAAAATGLLLLSCFCASVARAADAPATGDTAAPATGDAAAPTGRGGGHADETQAAAAQRAAQEAEAQVIELRRQIDALERQRASYDDVRRRLDQIDARQGEIDRQAAAARDTNPPETSVVRFRDGGFDIRSPDNGFYLHPMVRVQAIYTGAIASQGAMDPAPPDVSGFSLGRAEMILEGHVGGPFFQYRLQLDAAESPSLKDAYLAWQPLRMLSVEAGQFKVPYGLQRQYWKAELEFVNISAPMAAFSLERDLGLMLIGRLLPGRLTVQAALLNGSGANVPNDNIDLAYALRIVATPFGPLPVVGGGHRRPRPPAALRRRGWLLQFGPDRHRRPYRRSRWR